ncbi:MAG: TldD/PmbA family protein [SAR324 cluster bacterium]|nr:TldD/PmbA family protein [SAR324 cluster bacterium]
MMTPKEQTAMLLKNSEIMIDEIKGEGTQSEVCAQHSVDLSVVYEGNDFSVSKSNTTSSYGIRAIVDGKLGFMTSNSSSDQMLREIALETRKLAMLSVSSEHHQIATAMEKHGYSENYDPSTEMLLPSDLYNMLQLMVDEVHKEKNISLDRAEISCSRQYFTLTNSNGFSQQAAASDFSWFAMGMGKTKNEVTSFDYDGGTVRDRSALENEIIQTMERFRQYVGSSLGPRQAKDYKGAILLHPAAVMSILGQTISFNANGKNHLDGISAWNEQMGQQVASETLLVAEDPLDENRPDGWSPFDREGVTTSRHQIIDAGHLNFAAHNCFSAHQAGIQPTGNAAGGATGLPQIGFSNLKISGVEGKALSEELLYQKLGTGLVLKRFSGSCDPISGQFSGVAKNSWWVENGKRSHAVHETMVSGNAFDVLKQILAIGSQLHVNLGGSQAPYILIDGVSVTAG